ncbi:SDR family NAD(P)-dependent oxidoreductase [Cytobacillus sp. S13-E01]|uniref:SDR family NAD(P)-dependent oxidoreductase n=1 Tax=Cytobacillus sp. S13-E01 TaxID=3031326 RepID=UPI0023D7D5B0|nr:SDR family NAD(P)-dependent oxidoreductase [Cytobacillus sp. S13-E01]MDF0725915.1 SDR family NAD(P)-dependent oxidoreductase [Cytobacillus sp. S13-E01]
MDTVLITGAGSGLGKELALQYAAVGNKVVLVGRSSDKLLEVNEMINKSGGDATCYAVDVSNITKVEEVISNVLNKHSVSFLINNAGVGHFGSLSSLSNLHIEEMVRSNILGTIGMTKALLPHLLTLKHAKVMNIISTAGLKGKVNESVYVASKFAIRGFTESLVKELEGSTVSVTAVYMGGMNTPFWDNAKTHIKEKSRLRSPEEIAAVIINEYHGQPEIFI